MRRVLVGLLGLAAGTSTASAQLVTDVPAGRPVAVVDLMSDAGVRLVGGTWRYRDARVIDVAHQSVGPDLRASGPPNRTHDIVPRADATDFATGPWAEVDAVTLMERRASGKLSFGWYRISVTVPTRVGSIDPTGQTVVFEIVVDDYAEVWVDGRLPLVIGQSGGPAVRGWNAPNRVVLTRDARPGQTFNLAVFVANAPLSNPPATYIWLRSATLDFFTPEDAAVAQPVATEIDRKDAAFDAVVPRDARIEWLARGFIFTEGPVWVRDGGYLLFSDPNANRIYRWTPDGDISVYRTKSGYAGVDIGEYFQPGSNGMALDGEGRLTIAEHGNRRITRIERNGVVTILVDRYQGKRLNSPNDLVYRSDGALYFTDPPFGLPRTYDDQRKELPFSGVFVLKDRMLRLLSTELAGPNGLAFSPDERFLYVTNWDVQRKVVMRYEVRPDGGFANGRVFFDMTGAPGEEALDGVKVDREGNLFVSGPGGVWVISSEGRHLGTIRGPELPANLAWGDADGRSLYLTARTGLYRLRLGPPRLAGGGP